MVSLLFTYHYCRNFFGGEKISVGRSVNDQISVLRKFQVGSIHKALVPLCHKYL